MKRRRVKGSRLVYYEGSGQHVDHKTPDLSARGWSVPSKVHAIGCTAHHYINQPYESILDCSLRLHLGLFESTQDSVEGEASSMILNVVVLLSNC